MERASKNKGGSSASALRLMLGWCLLLLVAFGLVAESASGAIEQNPEKCFWENFSSSPTKELSCADSIPDGSRGESANLGNNALGVIVWHYNDLAQAKKFLQQLPEAQKKALKALLSKLDLTDEEWFALQDTSLNNFQITALADGSMNVALPSQKDLGVDGATYDLLKTFVDLANRNGGSLDIAYAEVNKVRKQVGAAPVSPGRMYDEFLTMVRNGHDRTGNKVPGFSNSDNYRMGLSNENLPDLMKPYVSNDGYSNSTDQANNDLKQMVQGHHYDGEPTLGGTIGSAFFENAPFTSGAAGIRDASVAGYDLGQSDWTLSDLAKFGLDVSQSLPGGDAFRVVKKADDGPQLGMAAGGNSTPNVNASKTKPDFIVSSNGTAVHTSQSDLRDSILNNGGTKIGDARKGDGEIFRMDTPSGPVDIRIMDGTSGSGPHSGPRTIVTEAGKDKVYVHPNGERIRGSVSKPERREIGHTHNQVNDR